MQQYMGNALGINYELMLRQCTDCSRTWCFLNKLTINNINVFFKDTNKLIFELWLFYLKQENGGFL